MITQEQAVQAIFDKNLVEAEIAYEIGVSPQALSYQLHKAKNFDKEVAQRLAHCLEKKGIQRSELCLNDRIHFKMLIEELRTELNKKLDGLMEFVEK